MCVCVCVCERERERERWLISHILLLSLVVLHVNGLYGDVKPVLHVVRILYTQFSHSHTLFLSYIKQLHISCIYIVHTLHQNIQAKCGRV